jgi:polyribonucleotide nucleotidyltransferase
MKAILESAQIGAHELSIETGVVAKQAHGSIVVRYGETVVLVTAVSSYETRADASFFPLTVEYRESAFASGKIPGGFFKREGRQSEKEILTSRVIDRPLRPLFPEGYLAETQIICSPLSASPVCDPDVLAITGASAALCISDIPFAGPIAGVRVIRLNGEFLANPSYEQIEAAEMNIVIAASRDAIVMVEGEAKETPEAIVIDALLFGHQAILPLLDMQERLVAKVGKPKRSFTPPTFDQEIINEVNARFTSAVAEAYKVVEKQARYEGLNAIKEQVSAYFQEKLGEAYSSKKGDIGYAFGELKSRVVRQRVIKEGIRIDGRDLVTVRPIDIRLGWLPRVHGSTLFTRGETQANVTVTLGTTDDEQRIETFAGTHYRNFMLHYNFPPYSVGEARPLRGPGRREIGHGNLAERSLAQLTPDKNTFPYTIRVVSDITESNGSSSMASVCGGSLALMDAGVPIPRHIAGVAMGLIKEGEDVAILTDILGDEDHLGDMDFKVTGTRQGVCAIQMDIKIDGLSREIFEKALKQAYDARLHILNIMDEAIPAPRGELSNYAPRIVTIWVKPERIREIIGPGGKMIRSIQDETGVKLDIEDSGRINLASPNESDCQRAIELIKAITQEVEVGKIYLGTVKAIKEFGAFVEIIPGREGLLHVSQIHHEHIERVTDILQEGDEVLVKVLEVDSQGKIRLSRKEAIEEQAALLARAANEDEAAEEIADESALTVNLPDENPAA